MWYEAEDWAYGGEGGSEDGGELYGAGVGARWEGKGRGVAIEERKSFHQIVLGKNAGLRYRSGCEDEADCVIKNAERE